MTVARLWLEWNLHGNFEISQLFTKENNSRGAVLPVQPSTRVIQLIRLFGCYTKFCPHFEDNFIKILVCMETKELKEEFTFGRKNRHSHSHFYALHKHGWEHRSHYNDVTMGAIASQITSLVGVYSVVWLGADQRKHQSSASLAFVRGIHRRPVNSPHKGPVTRKMFSFDDVITGNSFTVSFHSHNGREIACR